MKDAVKEVAKQAATRVGNSIKNKAAEVGRGVLGFLGLGGTDSPGKEERWGSKVKRTKK